MKRLRIIPEDKSLLHLQKLYIAKCALPEIKLPKAVKVFISKNVFYLCQVFTKSDMHPSFCTVDFSVTCFKEVNTCEETLPSLMEINTDYILQSNIQVIPKVSYIKSLSLTVIVESPDLVSSWKNKSLLSSLLKNVLSILLLSGQSYVFLDCIQVLRNIGVYCLYINCIGSIEVGRITSNTKIKIVKVMSRLRFEQLYQRRKNVHQQLGGMERHSSVLTEIIQNTKNNLEGDKKSTDFHQSHQLLIVGPPGCGKTTLVNRVAKDCKVPLLTIYGPELSNALPGETEKSLQKMFQDAKLFAMEEPNGVCVLLIDQVDSLCSRRDHSNESHVKRCSNYLLSLLDTVDATKCLIVVATTDRVHILDPAIRRPGRLDLEIHMGVPTQTERNDILRGLCLNLNLDPDISLEVARWTPGFVAADLALLCYDVARFIHKYHGDSTTRSEELLLSSWRTCLAKMQPSSLRGQVGIVDTPKLSLNDIGGATTIKEALKQAVEWPLIHFEAFARLGLPHPKGVLLYGPPGCAKTSLVRAISSVTNTTFLAISAAEIYSPYVGDSERTIAELFQKARIGAPSILFIDEIDALVGSRGDRESGSQERVLSAFLTEMDGIGIRVDLQTQHNQKEILEGQSSDSASPKVIKEQMNNDGVIVIAATNRPDMLDSALIRPGRFDKLFYVGPPDYEDRLDILQTITKKMPLSEDVDLPKIASMTELYSGADLNRLSKEAGLCALTEDGMFVEEVKYKHWLHALSDMKPSLTASQIEWYKSLVMR